MNESFQIIATLAAAQLVVAVAPGPGDRLAARVGLHARSLGFAVALGAWPAAVLWAVLGVGGLGVVLTALPGLAAAVNVVCGLWLAWIGIAIVRRSFADAAPVGLAPSLTLGHARAFRLGLRGGLAAPRAIAWYAALFAVTGALDLPLYAQAAAVAMMPTITLAWNVVLCAAVSEPTHEPTPRPRRPLASPPASA